MIGNYSFKFGIYNMNGTTRFHKYKYSRGDGVTGYEIGMNIIPRKFGFLFYLWVTNKRKNLEFKLRGKEEYIEYLKELITMMAHR